VSMISKSAVR